MAHTITDNTTSTIITHLNDTYLTPDTEEELLHLTQQHSLAELEPLLTGRDHAHPTTPTNNFTLVTHPATGGLRFLGPS